MKFWILIVSIIFKVSQPGRGEPVSIGHVCRLVPVGGLHEQRKLPVSTLKILTGN